MYRFLPTLFVLDSVSKSTNTINNDSDLVAILQEDRRISSVSDICWSTSHDDISLFKSCTLTEMLNDAGYGMDH